MAGKQRNRTKALRRRQQATAKNRAVREKNQEVAEVAAIVKRGVRTKPKLEEYRNRGQIDQMQYDAGMRFHTDWLGCGKLLSPGRVSAQAFEVFEAGHGDPTVHQIHCKRQFEAAIQAVGKILSSVLINVCLHNLSAKDWAQTFGQRPANDGIACLRLGLDGLRDHYENGGRDRGGLWKESPFGEPLNYSLAQQPELNYPNTLGLGSCD